ncbi:MAG: aminoglycoside phosphotransferase [Frondihabitans sp.]|nr:aminoglycoside phosphotransferase [Frondihabitans sp.]
MHNDYRSSNLITANSTIMAILDFDELGWDYCVSDLAHAGVYLGTLFREWGPTPPPARQHLLDGYQTVRALSDAEQDWLAFLTRCNSIRAGWPIEEPRES